jgi:hypothetical protein
MLTGLSVSSGILTVDGKNSMELMVTISLKGLVVGKIVVSVVPINVVVVVEDEEFIIVVLHVVVVGVVVVVLRVVVVELTELLVVVGTVVLGVIVSLVVAWVVVGTARSEEVIASRVVVYTGG